MRVGSVRTAPPAEVSVRPAVRRLSSVATSPQLVIVVFALGCAAAVAWRAAVLASPGVPPGNDGGNWLAFGRDLLGENLKPGSVGYPPVVPLLVTGMTKAFGATAGLSITAAVSAVAPAVGAFLLLYWTGLRWGAAVLAAFLLPASAISEAAAWGGYPQLLGTPFVLGGLWFLDRWLRQGRRRDLVGSVVAWILLLATSDFDVVIGVVAAPILVAIDLLASPQERPPDVVRRVGVNALLVGLAALPLLPTYARLVPAIVSSHPEHSATALSLSHFPSRFTSSLGGAWPLWTLGLVLFPVAVWSSRRLRSPLPAVAGALAISLGLLLVLTRQARMIHVLPVLAVLGAGLWWRPSGEASTRSFKEPASILLAAALALGLWAVTDAGRRDLPNYRSFYNLLDKDLVRAIDWIRTDTPKGSVVAVSSIRGAPLGWWVEGLGDRPTLTSTSLQWVVFPVERERAREANRVFSLLSVSPESALDAARSYGADYILVARGSESFSDAEDLASEDAFGLPIFRNTSTVILRVENADSSSDGKALRYPSMVIKPPRGQ